MYFTVAEFDVKYVDYIKDRQGADPAFLIMKEYGPFPTTDYDKVEELAAFVSAVLRN